MYAYVKYILDNVRKIVHINEIKQFKPKHLEDFEKRVLYQVFWADSSNEDGGYYEAHILKLGDSIEDLELAIKKKRISSQVLSMPCSKDQDDMATPAFKKIKRSNQNKDRQIIKQKLFTNNINTIQNKTETEVGLLKETIASRDATILTLKEKIDGISAKNDILTSLNIELQQQLLNMLKKGEEENITMQKKKDECHHGDVMNLSLPVYNEHGNYIPINEVASEPEDNLYPVLISDGSVQSHHVDVGCGIKLPISKWQSINSPSNSSSNFCKQLAVAFWGEDVLATRSVLGKGSNRNKHKGEDATTFPALSPQKVTLIQELLRDRLKPQDFKPIQLQKEVNLTTKYLNEKMNTIRRAQKLRNGGLATSGNFQTE